MRKGNVYERENYSLSFLPEGRSQERYDHTRERKYIEFREAHGFKHTPRVFDLYLRMCAEGMV